MLTIGEICAGFGGLAMGVQMVLDAEVSWVSEIAPGPSMILAHRLPGIANVGDLRTAPWEAIRPVDILTCGIPCQSSSQAGLRKGMEDDRWLWPDIQAAIGRMDPRPRLCLFECVSGLLTIDNGDALASVIHGLATLGYVGRYRLVRASDAGACHRRERWFCVAEDPDRAAGGEWGVAASRQATHRRTRPYPGRRDRASAAHSAGPGGHGPDGSGGAAVFGQFWPAVRRWELVSGRAAPRPADPGRDGKPRLTTKFVEFLMGLPDGWVTDVPGLSRREQLAALGNGVVPQQCALALNLLMPAEVCELV